MNLRVQPSEEEADRHGVTAIFFVVTSDGAELTRLAQLADEGRLQAAVARTLPLEQGRTAFESGGPPQHTPGKTVLVVR